MSERSRRDVLAYSGLAIAAGGLVPAAGSATSASGDDDGGPTAPDGWSSLGGDPGNTSAVSKSHGPELPLVPAWEYDHAGRVAVVDGTVYLRTADEVHALEAADGSLEWRTEVPGADGADNVVTTPAVAHDTVYVGGENLTAIDAEAGEVRWQLDLEYDSTIPSPNVTGDLVFVVADGVLRAIDAETGDVRWRFEPSSEPLHEQSVAIADGAVVAASESRLFALEVGDGTERWTYRDWSDDSLAGQFSPGLAAYPIATDDFVVALRKDQLLTIHDLETGTERRRITGYQNPEGAVTADHIFTSTGIHLPQLVAQDVATGDEAWRSEATGQGTTSPITDGDSVYAGMSAYDEFSDGERGDRFFAFDVADGTVDWQIDTRDKLWPLALVDGTLYTGTLSSGDRLIALRSETAVDGDDGDTADEDEADESGDGDSDDATDESGDGDGDDATGDDADGGGSDDATDESDTGDGDADSGEDGDGDETSGGEPSGSDDGGDGDGDSTSDSSETGSESESTSGGDPDDADGGDSETDDGMPGFTTGAGAVGGGLALEWLRRRDPEVTADE